MPYSDVALPGLDAKQVHLIFHISWETSGSLYLRSTHCNCFQCEERCDRSEDGFTCRAYTVDYSEKKPLCLLHSDDTIGLGVSSLVTRPNVIYKEEEACLDRTFQTIYKLIFTLYFVVSSTSNSLSRFSYSESVMRRIDYDGYTHHDRALRRTDVRERAWRNLRC